MMQCRFCGGLVSLEAFKEDHADRSCMVEASHEHASKNPDSEDESDTVDDSEELDDLVAIKKTNSVGQSRWHLFVSSLDQKSFCGHVELDSGLYDQSGRQLARKVDMDSVDELDGWLGRVCQSCMRVLETRQPGHTLPSVREEKLTENDLTGSIQEQRPSA